MAERTGRCLCGAVTFRASPKNLDVHVCHCGMCRRNVGGPLFAVDVDGPINIDDESSLGVYASSDWGERGFCKTCGTSLFWRMRDGSMQNVHACAFDDVSGFRLGGQIFIDEKPDFYNFAEDTPKLTGEQVFAMFAPGGETPADG